MSPLAFVSAISLGSVPSTSVSVCKKRAGVCKAREHVRATLDEDPMTYTETTLIPELAALDPSSGSTVLSASYALPGAFLITAAAMRFLEVPAVWVPFGVIGIFLTITATTIRFVFGPTRLSVARKSREGLSIIRGWEYRQFKNWEVWWSNLPVLWYIRENESYGGRGSIHFFPLLCGGNELERELRERAPNVVKD